MHGARCLFEICHKWMSRFCRTNLKEISSPHASPAIISIGSHRVMYLRSIASLPIRPFFCRTRPDSELLRRSVSSITQPQREITGLCSGAHSPSSSSLCQPRWFYCLSFPNCRPFKVKKNTGEREGGREGGRETATVFRPVKQGLGLRNGRGGGGGASRDPLSSFARSSARVPVDSVL